MNNYEIMLHLSSYIDSKIIEVENDEGELEEGIFIPIAKNAISIDPSTKFVTSWCYVTAKPFKSWSHYLKMKVDKNTREQILKLGMKPPYMGYMRVNRSLTPYFRQNEDKVKNIEDE